MLDTFADNTMLTYILLDVKKEHKIIRRTLSSACREILANDIYWVIMNYELQRLSKNRIIMNDSNLWYKEYREDIELDDIKKSILLFAGVIGNIIIKDEEELKFRKDLYNLIRIYKKENGVYEASVDFFSPIIYSSVPMFSLMILLIRIGFHIALKKRHEEMFKEIDNRFTIEELEDIVRNYDRDKSYTIWNEFLKDFSRKYQIKILARYDFNDLIDFSYKFGFNSLFPFNKLKNTWRRFSEFYGISRYLCRVPFKDRYDVRRKLGV